MSATKRAVLKAAEEGDLAVLERLLGENPALVNCAKTQYKETPLHRAAYYGHAEVAKALLEKGAAIEAKDMAKWTSLHYVAYQGHVEVANTLLEKGAATEAKNDIGETPLHTAAYWHKLECMMTLLEAGADVNAQSTCDATPVALALAPISTPVDRTCHRRPEDTENAVGILLAAGGSMSPGTGISPSVAAAAVAHTAIRAASLSDAAVADVERRIRLVPVAGGGCIGACPHVAARMLRDGCGERRSITSAVMAELPQVPDTAAWRAEQQRLDALAAAAAPGTSRFVPGMFISRAAVQLALGRVRSDAVSAARVDAAGRSIATLGEAVKMTRTSDCGDVSSSGGGGSGGAATAHDKVLYAAVRCVGRWGKLCSEATAAGTELASALQRLEEARSSAEAAAAALSRIQPLPAT